MRAHLSITETGGAPGTAGPWLRMQLEALKAGAVNVGFAVTFELEEASAPAAEGSAAEDISTPTTGSESAAADTTHEED